MPQLWAVELVACAQLPDVAVEPPEGGLIMILVISALLHITEPSSGKNFIDGVDIHSIGLHLRPRVSVISQAAIPLAGTIRYNLDPFQQYDDEKGWSW